MNNYKSIFVSIASYRDKFCSKTLESCYSTAKNPNNIFVGLCIQNDKDDEDCIINDPSLKQYNKNISVIRLKHHEAKGPTWARYLCATLYNNEDYFMQIDSHTLFRKDWDEILINMINDFKKNTNTENIVLSHYPPSYTDYDNKEKEMHVVDTICQSFFNDRGIVSFLGAEGVNMKEKKYVQTPHIAGGMFFSEGKCIKDVPYDPHLPYLFVGEEILHSARIWTSGYDIYSPSEITVYHLYTREDQPHIWDDKVYSDEDATNKVRYLMNFDKTVKDKIPEHVSHNIEKYGLGTKRTLKEYLEFAGIDTNNYKITKNFCKPFESDKSEYKKEEIKEINKENDTPLIEKFDNNNNYNTNYDSALNYEPVYTTKYATNYLNKDYINENSKILVIIILIIIFILLFYYIYS
jgi:hypothetical protein